MKVEQRIGRIDRIGQKHETIRILNFAYKDAVEADVYSTLGSRINLFRKIVGKLHPILSRLPRQFEAVALERPENREAAKQRLLADLNREARESKESPFDRPSTTFDNISSMAEAPFSGDGAGDIGVGTMGNGNDSCVRDIPGAEPIALLLSDGNGQLDGNGQPMDARDRNESPPGVIHKFLVTSPYKAVQSC